MTIGNEKEYPGLQETLWTRKKWHTKTERERERNGHMKQAVTRRQKKQKDGQIVQKHRNGHMEPCIDWKTR